MNTMNNNAAVLRPVPRTPYHSLDAELQTPVVPGWAQHRSVYRSEGRTLYLVETDQLVAAQPDLGKLEGSGWQVTVAPVDGSGRAVITMTRPDFARAA